MHNYVQYFIDVYGQSPFNFGATDICSSVSPDSAARAGAFAIVMNQAQSGGGTSHVKQVVVVAPPREVNEDLHESTILSMTVAAAEEYFGRPLGPEEVRGIARYVRVVHARDMRISSAIEALNATIDCSA